MFDIYNYVNSHCQVCSTSMIGSVNKLACYKYNMGAWELVPTPAGNGLAKFIMSSLVRKMALIVS